MCVYVPHACTQLHICYVYSMAIVACTLKLIKYMHLTQNEVSNGENQLQTDSQIMSRKNKLVATCIDI